MPKKKKILKRVLEAYGELKKKRQLQKVKDRMQSIIKTTVGEDVALKLGKEWAYSQKNEIIYYVEDGSKGIKELPTASVIGLMLHEIAHAKYSGVLNRSSFPNPQEAYALFINAIEDARIEEKLMQKFPGTYDTFKELHYNCANSNDPKKVEMLPPHLNLLYNYIRNKWEIPTIFTDNNIKKVFNKLKPLLDEATLKKDTEEMENYLYDNVWKHIKELIPPPDPKKPDSKQPDSKQQSSSEEQKKNKEEQKKNKEEQDFQNKIKNMINMEDVQDILKGQQKEYSQPSMFKEAEEEISQEDAMYATQDEDFKPSEVAPNSWTQKNFFRTYEELYADVAQFIPYFVKKINSIMTDNKLDRAGGTYRSGKLNTKILYKWKCNNPKLFKRKIMRQHKDYSVYLLVDQSGSMCSRSKILNAARACVLMAEVLKKSGIDFAIRGFNLKHKVYKTFNQSYNWAVKRDLENIVIASTKTGSGGNNDGYNINRASYELSKRTGEKIMIVISDGQPNESTWAIPEKDIKRLKGNYRYYDDFNLKEEIVKAKQLNTLIGVGINASYVEDFYPQAVLCNDIDALPNQLLNILRKNIRRG
jgi:hypothetical protein